MNSHVDQSLFLVRRLALRDNPNGFVNTGRIVDPDRAALAAPVVRHIPFLRRGFEPLAPTLAHRTETMRHLYLRRAKVVPVCPFQTESHLRGCLR